MSAVSSISPTSRRDGLRGLTRVFNVLVLRLAGTRWLPLYGVLIHHGRRSGRVFHTPVVVRPTADGFVVPMPWGEGTDWYRNVRAAGGCVMRWKGREYRLVEPRVLDIKEAASAFGAWQQRMLPRFGITQALHLRRAD